MFAAAIFTAFQGPTVRNLFATSPDGVYEVAIQIEIRIGIRAYAATTVALTETTPAGRKIVYKTEDDAHPTWAWVRPDGLVWILSDPLPGPGGTRGVNIYDLSGRRVATWWPHELPAVPIDKNDRLYKGAKAEFRGVNTGDLDPGKTRFVESADRRTLIMADRHGCEFGMTMARNPDGLWLEQDVEVVKLIPGHGRTESWHRREEEARFERPIPPVDLKISR